MKIVQAGGLAVIFAAMKEHATNAEVQEKACGALCNLALNGKEEGGSVDRKEGGKGKGEGGGIWMCLRERSTSPIPLHTPICNTGKYPPY